MKKKIYMLIIILICACPGLIYFVFGDRDKPFLKLSPDLICVNDQKIFQVLARDQGLGLRHLQVILRQDKKQITVLDQAFSAKTRSWSGEFKLPKLKQGPFELLIICTDRSWNNWGKGNTSLYQKKLIYDTKAPLISPVSKTHNLSQGGAGLVVYRVSEEVTRTGVEVGNYFFPAYQQKMAFIIVFLLFLMMPGLIRISPRLLRWIWQIIRPKGGFIIISIRENFERTGLISVTGF